MPDRIVVILAGSEDLNELIDVLRSTAWYRDVQILLLTSKQQPLRGELDPNVFLLRGAFSTKKFTAQLFTLLLLQRQITFRLGRSNVETIIRSIEFPPEYYQSGITILGHFASILRQKDLSENVKVSIEQTGLVVRLVIETPSGQRELIERTLNTYALVVSGQSSIDELTTDPYAVMDLKSALRIALTQVENQKELIGYATAESADLRSQIASSNRALTALQKRAEADSRRFMAMLGTLVSSNSELSRGLQRLTEQAIAGNNLALADALSGLTTLLERGVREGDKEEFIQKVQIIKNEDSGFFEKVTEVLLGSVSGAGGSLLYDWIKLVIGSLPK